MAIYGYIRVSTEEQVLGLEAQEHAIREKYPDAILESDHGVSGTDPNRPALTRILAALQPGDTVAVVRRDRLARDPFLAMLFDRDIKKRGARFDSLTEGVSDDNDPSSVLLRRITDAVAEHALSLTRARTKAALQAKKARGELIGSVPYGFRLVEGKRLEPNQAEQRVIAAATTMRAAGLTLRAIAAKLGAQGHRNRNGQVFGAQTIANMLKAALVAA
jgi:DNA invertase Pin-like site-specific DNA recombinase